MSEKFKKSTFICKAEIKTESLKNEKLNALEILTIIFYFIIFFSIYFFVYFYFISSFIYFFFNS